MVDNKWPPNLHVDSIATCVIMESRRETSFIKAAYLIFFFFPDLVGPGWIPHIYQI